MPSKKKMKRLPGVSFILRIRNEEQYLQASLDSLTNLTIPHEIVAILHKCTDGSKRILEEAKEKGQPIRIYETEQNLSKAGYETLATPSHFSESLIEFYKKCFFYGKYLWYFKWDADFTASPELVEFLNRELIINETKPIKYSIPCQMTETIINSEFYLFNCLITYVKHVFWEVPKFEENALHLRLSARILTIPPTVLKSYWLEKPWFQNTNSEAEKNFKTILDICREEPVGASRASCKLCDQTWATVFNNKHLLESRGVRFFD
jgi:glycosyltransferase involved in cell wall biosynthesis